MHESMDRGRDRKNPGFVEGYETARITLEVGEKARKRREELGLTQGQVAERAGLTQSALSRLEAGSSGTPTIGVLVRLAKALELELMVSFEDPSGR